MAGQQCQDLQGSQPSEMDCCDRVGGRPALQGPQGTRWLPPGRQRRRISTAQTTPAPRAAGPLRLPAAAAAASTPSSPRTEAPCGGALRGARRQKRLGAGATEGGHAKHPLLPLCSTLLHPAKPRTLCRIRRCPGVVTARALRLTLPQYFVQIIVLLDGPVAVLQAGAQQAAVMVAEVSKRWAEMRWVRACAVQLAAAVQPAYRSAMHGGVEQPAASVSSLACSWPCRVSLPLRAHEAQHLPAGRGWCLAPYPALAASRRRPQPGSAHTCIPGQPARGRPRATTLLWWHAVCH